MIGRRFWISGLPTLAATLAILAASPVAAEPLPNPVMPQHVRDARGFLFFGTLSRHYVFTNSGNDLPMLAFAVERVYAGRTGDKPPGPARPEAPNEILRPGHELRTYTPNGDGLTNLVDGHRYLVSGVSLAQMNMADTVAWDIHGEVATLVLMGDDHGDPRFAEPRTLDAAIALVAPELPGTSTLPLPTAAAGDSSVAASRASRDALPPLALVGALVAGAWLTLRLRSRRLERGCI